MRKIFVFLLLVLFFHNTTVAQGQQVIKGTVLEVVENTQTPDPNIQTYKVATINGQINALVDKNALQVSSDDKVSLIKTVGPSGEEIYYITDHIRTDSILLLFLIFVITVILISKQAGVTSLLGMGYSFFVIFKFLLPQLFKGGNPILITLITVVLIAPVSFILSHGINKKTFTALAATIISLTITSILALIFVNRAHLSGFGTEEAYFLQLAQNNINIQGIFLAGIIIGTLGILDDATVTQASIVGQLKASTRNLNGYELFTRAMAVGHDHIASTVNTLILVYTGTSLTLLLLFIQSDQTFSQVLNNQLIAEEVVTMLVSSIGLILSIPVATFMATIFVSKEDAHTHIHHH